jgi:hypothetical protein
MPMTLTTVTGPLGPLVARALPLRFDFFLFLKLCCYLLMLLCGAKDMKDLNEERIS